MEASQTNSYSLMNEYAIFFLRLGLGAVMIWFGLNEILNPDAWISYVPSWATSFGISAGVILTLNAVFEIGAGVLLCLGIYTRIVSLILFIHILLIISEIGLTSIGVRDAGIAAALLCLSLHEKDKFSTI